MPVKPMAVIHQAKNPIAAIAGIPGADNGRIEIEEIMDLTHSFRFGDDDVNRRLIAQLKKTGLRHSVDKFGVIHYSPEDEEQIENDILSSIRSRIFASWQVLSFPKEWAETYRRYMTQHGIPFAEEWIDGQLGFLIPGKYRPERWKLRQETATAV